MTKNSFVLAGALEQVDDHKPAEKQEDYGAEHYDAHESGCVGEGVDLDGEVVEGREAWTDDSVTTHDNVSI